MSNKLSEPKSFLDLKDEDKDLTMFTITNLTLSKEENRNMVSMAIKLKRKVATELLTTYLPTILLLLITFTSIFFDKDLFGDVIAVNQSVTSRLETSRYQDFSQFFESIGLGLENFGLEKKSRYRSR